MAALPAPLAIPARILHRFRAIKIRAAARTREHSISQPAERLQPLALGHASIWVLKSLGKGLDEYLFERRRIHVPEFERHAACLASRIDIQSHCRIRFVVRIEDEYRFFPEQQISG